LKIRQILLATAALVLVSCNVLLRSTGTPSGKEIVELTVASLTEETVETVTVVPSVGPTLADPTASLFPSLPTTTPVPSITPVLPCVPEGFSIMHERQIDGYSIELWQSSEVSGALAFHSIATVSRQGRLLASIVSAAQIDQLTGTDVTGDGVPDAVISTYSGGAHCCFSTWVYNLGPVLNLVLHSPESNCGGQFSDLDGDGTMEFVTCDDHFAYEFCPYANSPTVAVVFQYDAATGSYVVANTKFAELYDDRIVSDTVLAEDANPGEQGEWDNTTKCAMLPLVLDYLYSGQAAEAWGTLETYYEDPDIKVFWAEVLRITRSSPLFVESGAVPNVGLPPYYMLELLTVCGAERQYVGLLTAEGLDVCGEGVVYRNIPWLEEMLRAADLVEDTEHLALQPEGCSAMCHIDIINGKGAPAGTIRLDTSEGFPGEVYRVNGSESEHLVLRGDLSWQRR